MKKYLSALLLALSVASVGAQDFSWKDAVPEIHGTVRGKYEYQTSTNAQRFQVRNARVSATGKVLPIVSYKAEIDLCDEGVIKMLDAYARVTPLKGFDVTIGQMRVPFTIDAHRSPPFAIFRKPFVHCQADGKLARCGCHVEIFNERELPFCYRGRIVQRVRIDRAEGMAQGAFLFSQVGINAVQGIQLDFEHAAHRPFRPEYLYV